MMRLLSLAATALCFVAAACGGETAGEIVPLAIAVEPVAEDGLAVGEFNTKSGWHVQLSEAQLGVLALYAYSPQKDGKASAVAQLLDLLVPVAHAHGGFDPLNGRPVRAEYRELIALDLLTEGRRELGSVEAETGEVEELALALVGASDDLPKGLHGHSAWVAGEAQRDGVTIRFEGGLDLEDKGAIRRVESIDADVAIHHADTLVLGMRATPWLEDADFSRLAEPADGEPSVVTTEDQVGRAWYIGVRNPAAFSVELIAQGEKP